MTKVRDEQLTEVINILAEETSVLPQGQALREVLRRNDPIDELVATILSQNTRESEPIYRALRAALPTWEEVRDAPDTLLVEILRPGGLARVKTHRIKLALTAITETVGQLDLGHLDDQPLAQAFRWLAKLPGVGPKTAACVLLFGLGRPKLPVDDHIHRCVTRLGLVRPGLTPTASHAVLEDDLADDLRSVYILHTQLHGLSRQICKQYDPRCGVCPLAGVCDYS